MVHVEREESIDKNLKIKYTLGLVFSILLVLFGIDTIYCMVTTFYEHGGSEWQSWHPNNWVFLSDIEFPLIPALALSLVCLVIGLFTVSNLLLRWSRRQRTKTTMGIKKEPIQLPEIRMEAQTLIKRIQQVESEKEKLRLELWKSRGKPPEIVGLLFIPYGAMALISSVILNSPILAFIGLGLAFWGALLLNIKPTRYVKASLLDSTAISTLTTINRVITDLNYKGRGIYLPPRYLKEIKSGTVFIPSKKEIIIPPIEEVAQEKVFLKNPNGMCLTPPGLGLANLYEDELGTDFAIVDLDYLQNNLPKLFIEGLEIAEDLELSAESELIHVKIVGSIYSGFCSEVRKLSNICSLGCPLCSSIAIALTRTTGKPIIIERAEPSDDGKTIEVYYQIARAKTAENI